MVRARDTKNRKAHNLAVNDTLTMSLKSGKLHAAEGEQSCALGRVNRIAQFTSRIQVRCFRQAFEALGSTIDAMGWPGGGWSWRVRTFHPSTHCWGTEV
jgi:hypothetical protein